MVSGLKQCLNSLLLVTNSMVHLWNNIHWWIAHNYESQFWFQVNFRTFSHDIMLPKWFWLPRVFFCMSTCRKSCGLPAFSTTKGSICIVKVCCKSKRFLGTNEGHVNTSSRADISRFIICTRGSDRSRGYERHMGWREWETQDGVYKKRRECERNGQWREKTEATPESTVPLPHCTGMLAGGNSIHVTLFSPLSSGDWSPETGWVCTRPVRQKKPTNSQGNQTEVSN